MQKRTDIQNLEKDIADGEQDVAKRIQALDTAQAAGFQQQAVDAQQIMTQGRQSALQAPASVVGDYTAMIVAGANPNSFLPEGYAEYKKGTSGKYYNVPDGLSARGFKKFMKQF